jgi:ribosomal protein S25
MDSVEETRRRSAALFGNEKTAEVVVTLDEEGTATAQMIAAKTGISHSLTRDALIRLSIGGAIRQIPRVGGSRSPLYYQPVQGDLWHALTTAAHALIAISQQGTGRGAAHRTLPRQ